MFLYTYETSTRDVRTFVVVLNPADERVGESFKLFSSSRLNFFFASRKRKWERTGKLLYSRGTLN